MIWCRPRRCYLRYRRIGVLLISATFVVWLLRHAIGPATTVWNDKTLRILMTNPSRGHVVAPLFEITVGNRLTFFHLPKRRGFQSFAEITSANPDSSLPLAPDFTFHIRYGNDSLVIYEDDGPGCLYRIYLLPILPTDYSVLNTMTAHNLSRSFLLLDIDGRHYRFSMRTLMQANQSPFIQPLSTRHRWAMSGVGSYTPFCYQYNASVTYIHDGTLPRNLLQTMRNCTRDDMRCPVHLYSAVSRLKYAPGTRVKSYTPAQNAHIERVADLLSRPNLTGPDDDCTLRCVSLQRGGRRQIYASDTAAVIAAMKIRIFNAKSRILLENWREIHIKVYFDDSLQPSIDVSLGALFLASATTRNDFAGAFVGRMTYRCRYSASSDLPTDASTAYLYLPMPFWRNAHVYLVNAGLFDVVVCSDVTTVANWYAESSTGYLRMRRSCYAGKDGWRDMLTLRHAWGHVVGVMTEVNGLQPESGSVAGRWAALQADTLFYIDGVRAASVIGTGFEDYFSYAHGFARADNTSYSFVGVPYAAPATDPHAPRAWHCFRLHLLDPVPFQNSVQLITEGVGKRFQQPQSAVDCDADIPSTSFSHLVLFYARHHNSTIRVDTFDLADRRSERRHHFRVMHSIHAHCGRIFSANSKRYVGAVNENRTYNRTGRSFCSGDRFRFKLKTFTTKSRSVSLRREFYSPVGRWNEASRIWVDGLYRGRWVIPMGALSNEYSLRQADFLLENIRSRLPILIEIETLTEWSDISYSLV